MGTADRDDRVNPTSASPHEFNNRRPTACTSMRPHALWVQDDRKEQQDEIADAAVALGLDVIVLALGGRRAVRR